MDTVSALLDTLIFYSFGIEHTAQICILVFSKICSNMLVVSIDQQLESSVAV